MALLDVMRACLPRLLDLDNSSVGAGGGRDGEKGAPAAIYRGAMAFALQSAEEDHPAGGPCSEKRHLASFIRAFSFKSARAYNAYAAVRVMEQGLPAANFALTFPNKYLASSSSLDARLRRTVDAEVIDFVLARRETMECWKNKKCIITTIPMETIPFVPTMRHRYHYSGTDLQIKTGMAPTFALYPVKYGIGADLHTKGRSLWNKSSDDITYGKGEGEGTLILSPAAGSSHFSDTNDIKLKPVVTPLALAASVRLYSTRRNARRSRKMGPRGGGEWTLWKGLDRFLGDMGYTIRGLGSRVFFSFAALTITSQGIRELAWLSEKVSILAASFGPLSSQHREYLEDTARHLKEDCSGWM